MIELRAEIKTNGEPVLRDIAEVVTDIQAYQHVYSLMLTAMQDANGVGIAAPQIGVSIRAFIVASNPNPRYPDAPLMSPELMINPQLLTHGEETELGWEGCLSVPECRGEVPRYTNISVQYQCADGSEKTAELTGFVARIFQHELDHLDGILFIDRAISIVEVQ